MKKLHKLFRRPFLILGFALLALTATSACQTPVIAACKFACGFIPKAAPSTDGGVSWGQVGLDTATATCNALCDSALVQTLDQKATLTVSEWLEKLNGWMSEHGVPIMKAAAKKAKPVLPPTPKEKTKVMEPMPVTLPVPPKPAEKLPLLPGK